MTSTVPNPTIVDLEISDTWKKKFEFMQEARGAKLIKGISFKERFDLVFNIWAMVFGVFYYIAKGMWKKGLILQGIFLLMGVGLLLLEQVVGKTIPAVFYWSVPAAFFAICANRDYYALKVKGKSTWDALPQFVGLPLIVSLFFGSCVLIFVAFYSLVNGYTGQEPLGCEAPSVQETVIDLARGEVKKSIPVNKVSEFSYQMNNIHPLGEGDGVFTCTAQFSLVAGGSILGSFPITYEVSSGTDGGFYVQVYGL